MNISKRIIKDCQECDSDPMADCEKCRGCDEWNHFEYNALVKFASKERIWYCPKCVMIGNHEEFVANGLRMVCKRCGAVAEEITLER
jgi:hypothetical protein